MNLELIAETMTLVNNGLSDDFYHAIMANAPMQFEGHFYKFPDGTVIEAESEGSLCGHGLVYLGGSVVSASAVLNDLEYIACY